MNILKLVEKGIYLTAHAKDKMHEESFNMEDLKSILINGFPQRTNSTTVNKTGLRLNLKPHFSVTFNNKTVVCCESVEKGILVISLFHGLPNKLETNPKYRMR